MTLESEAPEEPEAGREIGSRSPFGPLSAAGIGQVVQQLSSLPDEQRRIVQLFYVDQFSVSEIAVETGQTEEAVSRLLEQILENFKAAYGNSPDQSEAENSHD